MIHVLADENIAGLNAYLSRHDNIKLTTAHGRTLLAHADMPADALFIRSVTRINENSLAALPNLPRFVGAATLGIDHVDTAYLKKMGVDFASAAGSSKHSVAQYVITAILNARPESLTTPIRLGIVGLGHIGGTLARYAKKLGWQVVGYDPFLPASDLNQSKTALYACDVISLHTPLTKTGDFPTWQMIDRAFLDALPPDTLLINAARGSIIDETALLADIKKTGRQAVLDVFAKEPTPSRTLIGAVTFATPHIAGYTLDAKLRGTDMIYQAFCRAFDLPILSTLTDHLPESPYHFSALKTRLHQGDRFALQEFYDLKKDAAALNSAIDGECVPAAAFDSLRKNYPLKREWLFDDIDRP
ncbi:MAG: 4-phosphoerythronate dehydrogenase [Moraxella sp.]|nr:4-phosphoerythronate dehydrogenase [Moraxella sp.]